MIVFLDTTVLLSDTELRGFAWKVLAQAASAWGVRLFVSEVSMAEAGAGYARLVTEAQAGLDRWGDKHSGRLGALGKQVKDAAEVVLRESESYPASLRKSLTDLDVTVVPPPDVSHTILVERATARRRPCNSQGDGYRDTLNWFSLLGLVEKHPDEKVVWVSDNSRDFASDDESAFHEDLIAELADIGAADRVTWIRNLQELIPQLAAEYAIEVSADLGGLQEKVHEQVLKDYLNQEVLSAASGRHLNPQVCGLPVTTIAAQIISVNETRDLKLAIRGTVGDSDAVAEFTLESDTSIKIDLPLKAGYLEPGLSLIAQGPTGSTATTSKPLLYSGLITLDSYGRPTSAELTRVIAREDDFGRILWGISEWSQHRKRQTDNTGALAALLAGTGKAGDADSAAALKALNSPDQNLWTTVALAMVYFLLQVKGKSNQPPPDNSEGEDNGASE